MGKTSAVQEKRADGRVHARLTADASSRPVSRPDRTAERTGCQTDQGTAGEGSGQTVAFPVGMRYNSRCLRVPDLPGAAEVPVRVLNDHDWDEDEAWLEGRRRQREGEDRTPSEEQVGPLAEDELPGSIYYVPHAVWNFPTRQPKDRPGVCVACDVPARWAWLCRGIDAASPVLRTHDAVLVPPSA